MRRASLALFILSLLFVFNVMLTKEANAQNSAQRIFSETGFDFKGIPRYTEPRHSFVFTNNGQDDLKLVAARVSCQCTKVFIPEKRVYKPGEKGEVVAQIDGVRFTGVRHVTVTVTFQRGSSVFEIPLNVEGVIIENVSLEPQKLTFLVDQDVKPSTVKDAPLQLNTNASNRTKQANVVYPGFNETVGRVASSSPFLDVKVGKPVRASNGTRTPVFVTVKNDAPAGYLDATVQLWSNGPSGGTPLVLNVTGVVRAPLTVSPGALTFYTPENGEKLTKNFVVSAPTEFTLKSVASPCAAVSCKFNSKALRPAKVCVVPVTFDPALLNDDAESIKLKIETTDGRVLFLDVQVSEGNYSPEVVAQKEARLKAEREAALLAAKEEAEKKVKEQQTSAEDFSNAKVSVSGASKPAQREAAPQRQERRVNNTPATIPPPTPSYHRPVQNPAPNSEPPFMPFGGLFAPLGGGY